MSFEEVKTNNFVKSNSIPVGEHLMGYALAKAPGGPLTPDKENIHMLSEDKVKKFVLTCHGNLNYFWENGNEPGYLYRFTRLSDKKNKMGKMMAQFKIEVDKSSKVDLEFYHPAPVDEAPGIDL